jgi:N6-adenosine-specific RNA methylase IME4
VPYDAVLQEPLYPVSHRVLRLVSLFGSPPPRFKVAKAVCGFNIYKIEIFVRKRRDEWSVHSRSKRN